MSGHWNYRLTVETVDETDIWAVREIYYDDAGVVKSWSKDPVAAYGETWLEAADDLSKMTRAIGVSVWDLDAKRWVDRNRKPVPTPGVPPDLEDLAIEGLTDEERDRFLRALGES